MIPTNIVEETYSDHKTDCLIIPCLEESKPGGILKDIDKKLNGAIAASYKDKRFEGKLNQTLLLNARGDMSPDNVLLAGLGKAKELTGDRLCQAAGTSSRIAEKTRCRQISFYLPTGAFGKAFKKAKVKSGQDPVCLMAQGSYLSLYHFDQYKKPDKDSPPSRVEKIVFLSPRWWWSNRDARFAEQP